jgi:hypothetical protein
MVFGNAVSVRAWGGSVSLLSTFLLLLLLLMLMAYPPGELDCVAEVGVECDV